MSERGKELCGYLQDKLPGRMCAYWEDAEFTAVPSSVELGAATPGGWGEDGAGKQRLKDLVQDLPLFHMEGLKELQAEE